MQRLNRFWMTFSEDQRGVTLVEYGIALVLAVGIGSATLLALGTEISDAINTAAAEMPD